MPKCLVLSWLVAASKWVTNGRASAIHRMAFKGPAFTAGNRYQKQRTM